MHLGRLRFFGLDLSNVPVAGESIGGFSRSQRSFARKGQLGTPITPGGKAMTQKKAAPKGGCKFNREASKGLD